MIGAEPVALDGEESPTSIFEQLGKAFIELEANSGASENMVLLKEIEEYFDNLERWLNKGFNDLEEKEKAFVEKKSEIRALVAEREAAVAAKEQALVDRVQELKDTAVAAIMETREKSGKHAVAVDFHVAAKEQALVDRVRELKDTAAVAIMEARDKSGKHTVAVDFQPRRELTRFCRQMDAKGLLNYIMEKRKNIVAIREEIPVALKSATEPARLVLDSLEGFYPPDQTTNGNKRDAASLLCMRKSCVMLMESVAPLLVGADDPLNPETKQQAKAIADKWKPRLDVDAANGNSSLEAEAFLQLLATFRITSEFDEEELCELVLAVAHRWQAPDLCRSLGLTHKMPVVVEKLINSRREIDAVHFVQAFKLTENFPPVPLLKAYLKDLRRNLLRKLRNAREAVGVQDDANAQELAALKDVIRCVEAHKLQADYPLDPLQKRVAQLEKSKSNKKKRMGEVLVKHQQPKRARANGGRHHGPWVPVDLQLQPPPIYHDRWSLHGSCREEVSSSYQPSYF
ncbi:Frigida-like [Macleaya cordata]|uniref:FRIGIDA-like protein n=1 Tax=Macleaya cordata TaxID=56857 RepID=A0A200QKK8_MACCD|nr:Frigida-like [Macleaya cordata]